MNKYPIRKATIKDIPDMVRLRRLMFEWMDNTDKNVLDANDQNNNQYFGSAMPDNKFHGWVAEDEGKIIACGGLVIDLHPPGPSNPTGKIGYIMNMSVDIKYRNQGIAKEIFRTILLFLKDNNIPVSTLHATEMGRKLYEKFGFSASNEMRLKLDSISKENIRKI